MSIQISGLEKRIKALEEQAYDAFLEMTQSLRDLIDVVEADKKNMPLEDFLAIYSVRFGIDKRDVEAHLEEMKKSLALDVEIREKGWPSTDYSSIP